MTLNELLILAFLSDLTLVAALYAWRTFAQQIALRKGEATVSDFIDIGSASQHSKPEHNPFELPVFALITALLVCYLKPVNTFDVAAAWLFVTARLVHKSVQALSKNVYLRDIAFTTYVAAIAILMLRVMWIAPAT
jgi:hypothetical protein